MTNNCAIIFANDDNIKMVSSIPKHFSKVLFKPMIFWVTDALCDSSITDICIVSNSNSIELNACLKERFKVISENEHQNFYRSFIGTFDFLSAYKGQNVLVLSAYTPFIDCDTIKSSLNAHIASKNDVTVISAIENCLDNKEVEIISEKAYWFSVDALLQCLNETDEKQDIPHMLDTFNRTFKKSGLFSTKCKETLFTAGDKVQLNKLNEMARKKELEKHMLKGVDIPCVDGVIISCGTKIGKDTVILPNTIIKENVAIGSFCTIGPNTVIENCEISDNSTLSNTVAKDSAIGNAVSIGPFSHIRPDCNIKDNVRIGNFVEIKNSLVDSGSKLSHLLYVGDTDVGKKVNFGCGSVTVNYTGKYKYRTTINDGAFIGCNSNLIAPVTVGKNAYIAAGSTITASVPENALAIAREKQTVKENWVIEKDPYK